MVRVREAAPRIIFHNGHRRRHRYPQHHALRKPHRLVAKVAYGDHEWPIGYHVDESTGHWLEGAAFGLAVHYEERNEWYEKEEGGKKQNEVVD